MDQYIGKRLNDRYEVQELVGVGGMANVYKAVDHMSGEKEVALKILREEFLENEEFVRRFKNESKAIAVLDHPNIVKVFDINFTDRNQYIVMEYVDGITLKEYINMKGFVNWKEVLHFTSSILSALDHAHNKGIIHRDVKPQNIMLLSSGEIKVMDFGIARFARSETGVPTNKAMGSVHYISPEQAKGEKTDVTTDVYSVGVMMYEMLTGKLPFEGDTPISVAIKQISDNPKRPRELNPNIPIGIEEIVIRAMQKEVQKRYGSADEMLFDLEEIMRDPSMTFGYRYMQDEETGSYFAALNQKTDLIETSQMRRASSRSPSGSNRYAEENSRTGSRTNQNTRKQKKSRKTQGTDPSIFNQEDDDARANKSSLMPILTGVGLAFAICAVIAIIAVLLIWRPFASSKEYDVPDVLGFTIEELESDSKYKDFRFKLDGRVDSDEYEVDQIVSQDPEPGKKIKKGNAIKVKVSKGAETVLDLVPSLKGLKKDEAVKRLTELGIKYKIEEIDSTLAKGEVIRTSPDAGEKYSKTEELILFISKGIGEESSSSSDDDKAVPEVIGFNLDNAKKRIIEAGFKVGTVKVIDSDKTEGIVLTQDPAPGSALKPDGVINLEVSNGKAKSFNYILEVNLPQSINYDVIVEIVVGGQTIYKKAINPSFVGSITEKFVVSVGDIIDITIDGDALRSYEVVEDGDSVKLELIYDNTSAY